MGLRNKLIALFLVLFIHFSLFPISHVNIENLYQFSWEVLKLESYNLVYVWMMSCGLVLWRIRPIVLILPFIYPFSVF